MAYNPNATLTDGTDSADITASGEVKVSDTSAISKLEEIDTNTTGLALEATQQGIKTSIDSVITAGKVKTDGSSVTQPISGSVGNIPVTSGGLYTHSKISGATSTVETLKGSAGQIYGYHIYNNASAARKVMFYNTTGTVTIGTTTVFDRLVIPANGGATRSIVQGKEYSTGIKYVVTSDLAADAAGTVVAGDLTISIDYK